MRLEYDARANAAYLYLVDGVKVASTEVLGENVHVDLDSAGDPIGVEFLDVQPARKPYRRKQVLREIRDLAGQYAQAKSGRDAYRLSVKMEELSRLLVRPARWRERR